MINLGIRMIVVVIIIHSDHHDRNEYWRFQKNVAKAKLSKNAILTPPLPKIRKKESHLERSEKKSEENKM